MKVIGFGHQSRTGKDTATDFLCNKFIGEILRGHETTYTAVKMSFAGPLKTYCRDIFPRLREAPYYDDNPQSRTMVIPAYGLTPIEIWVKVGTAMKVINPTVWIDLLRAKLKAIQLHRDDIVVVISDVRSLAEIDFIHEFDEGICVKIERPGIADQPGAEYDRALTYYETWDHTIINDGTLEEFKEKVAGLAHSYIVKGIFR